jgi:capsular polysaccharide biosynthesis protein
VVGPRPRRRLTVRQWLALGLLTVVLAALGGAAGWLVAQRLPTTWTAQAELLYSLTQEQPTGFLREDRNLSTQLVLLESRTVLAPVARQNNMSVEDLAEALEASVISESEVIQLRLTDNGRRRAANMLQSIVDQYLVASANTQRAELRTYLEGQLQGVVDQIAALRADAGNRQGEIDALAQREQVIRSQLDEVRFTELAGAGAQVLVAPFAAAEPTSPKPLIAIGAGVTAALVIALLAVAVIARRMTRP